MWRYSWLSPAIDWTVKDALPKYFGLRSSASSELADSCAVLSDVLQSLRYLRCLVTTLCSNSPGAVQGSMEDVT